ncbi:MAG: hypothetical protein ABIV43_02970 [Candidatus Saccharimonadales bacterium]
MLIENPHWKPTGTRPHQLSWASYLVLSPPAGESLNKRQLERYGTWLASPNYANIQLIKIRRDPELFYWALSFVIEAPTEKQAIANTARVALEGLDAADVNVGSLQHVENHLEPYEKFTDTIDQALRSGQPPVTLDSHRYDVNDPGFAYHTFIDARKEMIELTSLLN